MAGPISSNTARRVARSAIRRSAMATARWRVSPDLVIIGVKRGGTTSLFRDLESHRAMLPLVPSARILPLRENQKGVHYFDTGYANGDAWYRSHFPLTSTVDRRRRNRTAAFTAEASPYYFFHPLVAGRAASTLADAQFVVMLRDPVERTVSHWAEQTRNGVERLSLRDALEAEPQRVGDSAARLRSGSLDVSFAHEQQTYAAQSEYADSLVRWLDAVGPDRLTVVFSEDYYADPAATVGVITARLGVAPIPHDALGARRNAAPRSTPIDAESERELVERFRPDVARTTDILGRTPPWPRFGLQRGAADPDTPV